MNDIITDAALDTLKVFPFLLLIYMVIELLEHKTSVFANRKILQGRLSPLIGSAAGLVPLCGFSVMAAKLYDKKYIRTGTLLAVFIATSDEAVILLLSNVSAKALSAVLPLLIIKFILAVAVGYAAYAILSREKVTTVIAEGESTEYTCGHDHKEDSPLHLYFLTPLAHAGKIAIYLLVVNIVFGYIIYFVGEKNIAYSLGTSVYLQPLITSAVGLIPSCASSVILTSAYTSGIITFGSMTAGLVVNAGMGFMMLIKNFKRIKQNLAILITLFILAYVTGLVVNFLAPYFII